MTTKIHFIGISGSGISAIARVLLESGYIVSGSDLKISPMAMDLAASGARVMQGHLAEHIQGVDFVIRSSAVPDDNIEVQAAKAAKVPVYKRAKFLGQLMVGRNGIAVAGTHGKTTTTAMIAWMLTALGQDPTFIVGGIVANLGANAHAGKGLPFVIEADEYDSMFLGLQPQIAVVTNIEHDHPDCFPTPQLYFQAFGEFSKRVLANGLCLVCQDDPGAARLGEQVIAEGRRVKRYAISDPQAEYRTADLVSQPGLGYAFTWMRGNDRGSHVSLQVPGLHNVANALAALCVADELDLPLEQAAEALSQFQGSGRRFEVRGEAGGVVVIDDYAHHPTEIKATLSAAKARYANRRLCVVWQPHTYSRTMLLFDRFAQSFTDADCVIVTDVFPAREAVNPNFSAGQVVMAMNHPDAHFIPDLVNVTGYLLEWLQPDDVLIVLSAGNAVQISTQVLAGLSANISGITE